MKTRTFLFLQGPLCPFYESLSKRLFDAGYSCTRILLNGGDAAYGFHGSTSAYRETKAAWKDYIAGYLSTQRVTDMIVYGDCRFYHREAIAVARMCGVKVWVFEEGYIRPNYITLEELGVNAYSRFLPGAHTEPCKDYDYVMPENIMFRRTRFATKYYAYKALGRAWYRHYHHHRPGTVFHEAFTWLRSFIRKPYYLLRDKLTWWRLSERRQRDNLFVVALQVDCDSQIRVHSNYQSASHFVAHAVNSFCIDAPKGSLLVVKHHPMDRGVTNYARLISSIAKHYDRAEDVIYGHEFEIPELLRTAAGFVSINSTVTASAMARGVPVFLSGGSIYSRSDLLSGKDMHLFWQQPKQIERRDAQKFLNELKAATQIKGSFYAPSEEMFDAILQRLKINFD